MTTWVTADHHFGHARIIEICQRPFSTVEEMDREMVDRWNGTVGPEDIVWHLGDFACRCGPNRMRGIFDRLTGREIHLVRGNHDKHHSLAMPWTSVQHYAELQHGNRLIVLFHYALREWNKSHYGSWSLHGHSHGRLPQNASSCDVGVDAWNFRPIAIEEIERHLLRP